MENCGVQQATIRVVIVDDHDVVRAGVAALLNTAGGIVVCGEAGTVHDAVAVTTATRPDVVVMDVRLTDGSGIEATREIRAQSPPTRVIMLTSFSDEEAVFASIMAGASGYVLKGIRRGELVSAVREVAAGKSLLDPELTAVIFDRMRRASNALKDEKLASLSPREDEILALIAKGLTNREIGDELRIAEKTVKNSISQILSKLQVARRSEAAAYLTRHTTLPGA